jgi:diguanylate cyclase (GGDEF)-like protein
MSLDAAQNEPLQPKDLPSPPAVLTQVMRLANDANVKREELARVIAADPMFAAELIRVANSPFYGLMATVKTVSRALVVLGDRTVRCLAICFAARDVIGKLGFGPDDLADFWEDALRRGTAARRLARLTRQADPEEAFTVGLLLEFGVVVLLSKHRGKLADWRLARRELPDARRVRERSLFGTTHDAVAQELLKIWGLPDALVVAVAQHHQAEVLQGGRLGLPALALICDRIGAIFTAHDSHQALASVRSALGASGIISSQALDELVGAVSADVTEAAAAFGIRVRQAPSQIDMLQDANRALTKLNLSYEELTVRLERTLQEKEQLAGELQKANQRLRELVYFDPLTGLANRRHFEESFLEEIERLKSTNGCLTLLMVDLDHFKRVNDDHGHPTGDSALKAVAEAIQRTLRKGDLASRFGGEEMAILMADASEIDGQRAAERIRLGIERVVLDGPNGRVPLTASLGGTTEYTTGLQRDDAPMCMRRIIETADRALYAAKRAGRNRVMWSETF